MSSRKIFVIIPAFNESQNIPRLVESLGELTNSLPHALEFILVDDGSRDDTAAVAQKNATHLSFHVLKHPENQGPGKAFATGFEFLLGKLSEQDIVVTIEGDNTSRIDTLRTMLGRIINENADCAFASVYAYGGGFQNTSAWRIFLSHCASFLTKVFLNVHGIHTFTSFFRAYKGSVIITLQKQFGPGIIESRGFECMIELLKKIMNNGFSISEVPMLLDTSDRKGKSKMKILKTVAGYMIVFVRSRRWKFDLND